MAIYATITQSTIIYEDPVIGKQLTSTGKPTPSNHMPVSKGVDFQIIKQGPASTQFVKQNIRRFSQALKYVQQLPYGRNEHEVSYLGVLEEGKGTCSSKHGLLKALCDEMEQESIQLCLVLYLMNGENTPGVGSVLKEAELTAIPEAHCVLRIEQNFVDVTSTRSQTATWQQDMLHWHAIEVSDLQENKVKWHQEYIKEWLRTGGRNWTIEEIWAVRERCIQALTQTKSESNGHRLKK